MNLGKEASFWEKENMLVRSIFFIPKQFFFFIFPTVKAKVKLLCVALDLVNFKILLFGKELNENKCTSQNVAKGEGAY